MSKSNYIVQSASHEPVPLKNIGMPFLVHMVESANQNKFDWLNIISDAFERQVITQENEIHLISKLCGHMSRDCWKRLLIDLHPAAAHLFPSETSPNRRYVDRLWSDKAIRYWLVEDEDNLWYWHDVESPLKKERQVALDKESGVKELQEA